MMTIHVSQDVESSINAAVQSGRYASADEMIAELVREEAQRTRQPPSRGADAPLAGQGTDPVRKPIWEVAAEIRESIPAEEWAKLPPDGARQIDHYIYGSPKRPSA